MYPRTALRIPGNPAVGRRLAMNRIRWLAAFGTFHLISATTVVADDDLVGLMSALQTFTHKLQLSLDNDNTELAAFYAHEVEELIEEVGDVAEYDGHPVGQLATAMLDPALRRLGSALTQAGDIDAAARELDAFINACNACHVATDHAFIVIERNPANPYLQSFEAPSR